MFKCQPGYEFPRPTSNYPLTEVPAICQIDGTFNVPFEMMLYPGYTHRVSGENISPHRYNTVFRFLESHGVTPPE